MISYTAVSRVLALVGLHYSDKFNAEQTQPYFQLGSGVLLVGIAFWMFARTRRGIHAAEQLRHRHGHSRHDYGSPSLPSEEIQSELPRGGEFENAT